MQYSVARLAEVRALNRSKRKQQKTSNENRNSRNPSTSIYFIEHYRIVGGIAYSKNMPFGVAFFASNKVHKH